MARCNEIFEFIKRIISDIRSWDGISQNPSTEGKRDRLVVKRYNNPNSNQIILLTEQPVNTHRPVPPERQRSIQLLIAANNAIVMAAQQAGVKVVCVESSEFKLEQSARRLLILSELGLLWWENYGVPKGSLNHVVDAVWRGAEYLKKIKVESMRKQ